MATPRHTTRHLVTAVLILAVIVTVVAHKRHHTFVEHPVIHHTYGVMR